MSPIKFAVCAGTLLLFSCRPATGGYLPPPPPQVNVSMTEMKFDHSSQIPPGRSVWEIHNRGRIPHRLIVAPLPDDLPPVGDLLARDERFRITPLAGIANHPPGGRATFAVSLAPGRYGMFCLIVDPDGQSHAKKGMFSEFRIPGRPPASPPPQEAPAPGEEDPSPPEEQPAPPPEEQPAPPAP